MTFSARVNVGDQRIRHFWNRTMPRNGLFTFEHFELFLSQFLALSLSLSLSRSSQAFKGPRSTVVSSSPFPSRFSFSGLPTNQRNAVFSHATHSLVHPLFKYFCLARKLKKHGPEKTVPVVCGVSQTRIRRGEEKEHYRGKRNRKKRQGKGGKRTPKGSDRRANR
ncbi:uncharacterized protein LY79DRAFT_363346 [Colletotrichum navitas]|uniref:Uncharacterized protein n=1 Tax=Colletotrichum navitas TaxID=681940 RepID=A0AAD8PQQ5_9PEZI|nr:uncharacterized protein LY79DRAFT_363346 [Colletotrichum navitas]KAK1574582.1 hypothetical protein LY79DRAFT_363346 [Colletotrichum navitas]